MHGRSLESGKKQFSQTELQKVCKSIRVLIELSEKNLLFYITKFVSLLQIIIWVSNFEKIRPIVKVAKLFWRSDPGN